jgi:uncharacterized repeat protein (TIGR01451 family)
MHGRIAGLIAAGLMATGVALAGELPATEPPAGRGQQPVLDVRQRLPESVSRGEAIPIEILITNTGSVAAQGVTAVATLPVSVDLTEAAPTPERLRGTLLWSLGSLGPGQQSVLRLRVQPRADVSLTEVRCAVQVTFQTSVATSGVVQIRRPELELEVAGPQVARVGEPVAFELLVRNKGTTPARGVFLETLLPAGLSHPGGNDLENEVGNLEPGEVRRIALRVTPIQAGDLRQRLRLRAAGEQAIEREARLYVQDVRLTLAANGPRALYEGWSASFEFFVRNEGTDAVRQVRLTAVLPAGIAFVRSDADAVYAAESHSLSWDLGSLRPGEQRHLLWNGTARGSGEQVGQATLMAGTTLCKRGTWQTSVVRAPLTAPRDPEGTRTGDGEADSPVLTAPPPPLPPAPGAGPVPGVPPAKTGPTPPQGTAAGMSEWQAPGAAEPARPPPGPSSTGQPP